MRGVLEGVAWGHPQQTDLQDLKTGRYRHRPLSVMPHAA